MKVIRKIKTRFEEYGPEQSRKTLLGELNYESGKVFFLTLIVMVAFLPYIPTDLQLHANPVYLLAVKLGLSLLCIVLIALRFTRRFRHRPGLLLMYLVGYLYLGAAVIMATSGYAAARYVPSFTLVMIFLAFLPLPLKFKITALVTSLVVFFSLGMYFGINFSNTLILVATSDLILAVSISFVMALRQNQMRISAWEQRNKLIATLDDVNMRDKLLDTVNRVATILLKAEHGQFTSDLHSSMALLAGAVKADRVYIWKNHTVGGKLHCTQIYEWSEEAEPQQGNEYTVDIPYSDVAPSWIDAFAKDESINSIVREMPDGVRQHLSSQGVVSILVVPITLRGHLWGFMGFDDCCGERLFTETEETILRSASLLIANAFLRNETVNHLREASVNLEDALMQAKKADKSKSDFLATMSHEIRTPLNAVLGIAQLKMQNENYDEETTDAFKRICSSGTHLLGIVNDLLDLSRIETGKLELLPGKYDLPDMISDSIQLNIVRIGSKPISLVLEVDETLPCRLLGDELRLKQILNNLLSNAIKYTDEGQVKLSVSYAKEQCAEKGYTMLQFEIADTGQGIKPEDKDRVFYEYTRFNAAVNRNTEGSGIGLFIVKRLVQMMEGAVAFESEYGVGSAFSVTVKQKVIDGEQIGYEVAEKLRKFTYASEKHTDGAKINHHPMPYGRVLVVDDVETNLHVARGFLEPYKLMIETCTTAVSAIEKVRNGNIYDVIFMDYMMPEMDGVEAAATLHKMGYRHPIVALTANAVTGASQMFLDSGFSGFISKPIDPVKLDECLMNLIYNKQQPSVRQAAKAISRDIDITALPKLSKIMIKGFLADAKKSVRVLGDVISLPEIDAPAIKSFTIQAHAIKSALRNVGRSALSDNAYELEKAAAAADVDAILAKTPDFLSSLSEVVREIEEQGKNSNP